MEEQSELFPSSIKIDSAAGAHIRSIASWAMIVVVTTVFGYVLNIIALFLDPGTPAETQSEGFSKPILSEGQSTGGTIFTILLGLAINYFLYRFASGITGSINVMSQEKFSSSFRYLRIYFAIITVLMFLALLFVLIAVPAFI
jgi:hypothetical protein